MGAVLTLKRPTVALAACAWLATVPELTAGMIATTRPADTNKWRATGFVTVNNAGGTPGATIPTRHSLIQLDTWWAPPVDSPRPLWGHANQLAEHIIDWCYASQDHPMDLDVKSGFGRVRVFGVTPAMDPHPMYGESDSIARMRLDVLMDWVPL